MNMFVSQAPIYKSSVYKNVARLSAVLLLAFALTACGFHLRGNIPLPKGIQNMYVQAPDGTFKDKLEDVLSQAGATIAPSALGADVIVNVTDASSRRAVGTLDERGKVDSYNLVFSVQYSLDAADGKIVRQSTSLQESRQYDFDPELVLESESEEEQLLTSMEEDVALRIVRQLSTVNYFDAAAAKAN